MVLNTCRNLIWQLFSHIRRNGETYTQLCVSIVWFVSLLLLRPMWIFMTWIPSLSPGRFLQSRSALKWSINSIRTPTPLWRFSTHVSASSAPHYSPKSSPAAYLLLHTALEDNSLWNCEIAIYIQTNERHKFCSQRVFSYNRMSDVNPAWGWCNRFVWQMYTHVLVLLEIWYHVLSGFICI